MGSGAGADKQEREDGGEGRQRFRDLPGMRASFANERDMGGVIVQKGFVPSVEGARPAAVSSKASHPEQR